MESADRRQSALVSFTPITLGEHVGHRLTDERGDWLPTRFGPLLELPSQLICELNLHTLHVQNGSVYVNHEALVALGQRGG